MSPEVLILLATAVLAVVAVIAAVIAVVAVRRIGGSASTGPSDQDVTSGRMPADEAVVTTEMLTPAETPRPLAGKDVVVANSPVARVVEGKVVVVPTQQQVVAATLSRPGTRAAIAAHGVLYALRPESRDRIAGLMRREFGRRRRERSRLARRAARQPIDVPSADAESEASVGWLGRDLDPARRRMLL